MSTTLSPTPVLTYAADIAESDPWTLFPTPGSLRLVPAVSRVAHEFASNATVNLPLYLTDLGYLDACNLLATEGFSPVPEQPNGSLVLLMMASAVTAVAQLQDHAGGMLEDGRPTRTSEGWLATAHHFLTTGDTLPEGIRSEIEHQWSTSSETPPPLGSCRYLLGLPRGHEIELAPTQAIVPFDVQLVGAASGSATGSSDLSDDDITTLDRPAAMSRQLRFITASLPFDRRSMLIMSHPRRAE